MTMPLELRARHILALAADHIEKYGKAEGGFGSDGNKKCALRAILEFSEDGEGQLFLASRRLLQQKIGQSLVAPWSDSHTQAEVVATMRAASGV